MFATPSLFSSHFLSFFSNISKMIFELDHKQFCREFQALSFDLKNIPIKRIIEEKFQKYEEGNAL